MKSILTLLLLVLVTTSLLSQDTITLTDNLTINSDSHVVLADGQYQFGDAEQDGVIHIIDKSNVILDGNNVELSGTGYFGFGINIEGSENIRIENFESLSKFFYAIRIKNSTNITINNNTLSNNKTDSIGWITIFNGSFDALGGGIFIEESDHVLVDQNIGQFQNDGVAVYESDSIFITNNNFSWNTGYGVRLYHTHESFVDGNDCSHVNRTTDPSDCASILLLDAFRNTVTNNDFTYSGDGIFLNNYNTMEPADNHFENNDCSYSPHNAIEAVFSSGNTFVKNICNYSNYGFWLGYSFDNTVEENEIIGNSGLGAIGGGGIAIDRGYTNRIINNFFKNNSNGIICWEGNPIAPYGGNDSKDYLIKDNKFEGNKDAINLSFTEDVNITGNVFNYNATDIKLDATVDGSTINDNVFNVPINYYIDNRTITDIDATGNTFPDDVDLINCKIYDQVDDPGFGLVSYAPFSPSGPGSIETDVPDDLAEPDAIWDGYYYVEDAAPTAISWDGVDKKTGDYSLHISTESGWDVLTHYYPGPNTRSKWSLDPLGNLTFWLKIEITDPNNIYGIQEAFIRLGNECGGYYELKNEDYPHYLNQCIDEWVLFTVSLDGDANWSRSKVGDVSYNDISYVELNVDVWEFGYNLWLDGFSLPSTTTSVDPSLTKGAEIELYPNPSSGEVIVSIDNNDIQNGMLEIRNVSGQLVQEFRNLTISSIGTTINLQRLNAGIYFIKYQSEDQVYSKRFIKQ